ncbi:Ger(x)C family spore germination protein [Salipaludibacillus sp. CF4.18]|uniref:Ger(x)C family spore germination protein n=1 Tax=Salipaludibacillus sp. CF4.18 TaxID=3373081 RepID=UPI003EE7BA9E
MPKWIAIVFSFSILLILPGCWSATELKDLSLISAMGIDKLDNGDINVSFQVVNASEVAGQQGASRDASPTSVFSSTGKTIFEAARKATQNLPNPVYSPHLNLVVLNEKFAEEGGLFIMLDVFERDNELRSNAQVMISKGTDAKSILMVQSPVERVNAEKVTSKLENLEKFSGENIVMDIDDVASALTSKGKELILSGIQISGDKEAGQKKENIQQSKPNAVLEINGTAMFKDEKLIDWLNEDESKGVTWVLGRIRSTIDNVECEGDPNAIAIETLKSNANIQSIIKNDKPSIQITIQQEGSLGEVNCGKDFSDPQAILDTEKLLADEIKKTIESAISTAQEKQVDIFGFGDVIYRQHPDSWKEYESNWPEMFADLDITVRVQAHIRLTGMRINSFQHQK